MECLASHALDESDSLWIIGTTTPRGAQVPSRLEPLFQRSGQPDCVLVPFGVADPPSLVEESVEWLEEQEEAGQAERFSSPLELIPGTLLLHTGIGSLPEQIAPADLNARLAELRGIWLEELEQLVGKKSYEAALERSSAVLRASEPSDTTASLLQLGLLDTLHRVDAQEWLRKNLLQRYGRTILDGDAGRFLRAATPGNKLPKLRELMVHARRHLLVAGQVGGGSASNALPSRHPYLPNKLPPFNQSVRQTLMSLAA